MKSYWRFWSSDVLVWITYMLIYLFNWFWNWVVINLRRSNSESISLEHTNLEHIILSSQVNHFELPNSGFFMVDVRICPNHDKTIIWHAFYLDGQIKLNKKSLIKQIIILIIFFLKIALRFNTFPVGWLHSRIAQCTCIYLLIV